MVCADGRARAALGAPTRARAPTTAARVPRRKPPPHPRHLHMFEQTELVLPAEAARELAERAWREAGACELRVQPEEEV